MLEETTKTTYDSQWEASRTADLSTWSGAKASSHSSLSWVVGASLCLFIACLFSFVSYAYADVASEQCVLQGKVLEVGTGLHETTYFDAAETRNVFAVSFTEISVRIDRSEGSNNCAATQGQVAQLGVCQDIALKPGDYIRSDIDAWLYSPACLSKINILKRSHS